MFPTNITNFSQIFEGSSLVILLVVCFLNGILLYFASLKFLLVLQQSSYRYKRYFKWLKNKNTPYRSRLMLLCLLAFLFFCVLNVSFAPVIGDNAYTSYLGFISYVTFTLLYIKSEASVNEKIPLKKTKRLIRLAITFIVLLIAVTFGLLVLLNYLAFVIDSEVVALLRFSVICLLPILLPNLLFVAYCINEPFEELLRLYYLKKAKRKIDGADVVKIAITGSYGKTSVKEILKTILSQKFRVLASPESYNTPLGIALAVKGLDSTHDVFIAEMGARFSGDIKMLTEMVKPHYGVLTGINNQHLETFGSFENIKQAKNELFANMPEDSLAFYNADCLDATELALARKGECFSAAIDGGGAFVTATDITVTEQGATFMLNIQGENPVKCKTILLGRHSVRNICLATAVAYKLGLTPQEISAGVNRIKSVGHRLELIPNNKNIVVIDDSYNSNVDGVNMAMEVLEKFEGRKIVLTPGLVELGKDENVANFNMGKTLAKHADIVVVIGKHNAEMLIKGCLEGGMQKEQLMFEKSVTRGNKTLNQILKEGDVVLFENDLPDNYS